MSAEATAFSPAASPLDTVGDAMHTVAGALADGVGEATANVHEALPKMDRIVTRGVYKGSYYLTYGIVFPTALLFQVIPGGKALAAGIVDGALAGRDYVRGLRQPPVPR